MKKIFTLPPIILILILIVATFLLTTELMKKNKDIELLQKEKLEIVENFHKNAIIANVARYNEVTGIWQFRSLDNIQEYINKHPIANANEKESVFPSQNIDPVLTTEQVEAEIKKVKGN